MYSSPGERKHDIAAQHLATNESQAGTVLILVSKAPALVWEAQQTGTGKLGQLVPKQPWPYVNHYSFHILDPDWGHLTIKMSGHPPFGAQVMLNGHEYVACQAQKAGIRLHQTGQLLYYCLQRRRLGESRRYLVRRNGLQGACANSASVGFIPPVSVLLSIWKEQKRSAFRYQYSVYQIEYSRNLLFQSGRQMDQIFQALIDRTRGPLGSGPHQDDLRRQEAPAL